MKLELEVKFNEGDNDLWYFYEGRPFLCASGIDATFDNYSVDGEKYTLEFSEKPLSLDSAIVGIRRRGNYDVQWNWGDDWNSNMSISLRRYLRQLLEVGQERFLCVSLTLQ